MFDSQKALTNSERRRAAGKCDTSACPLYRHQYYESVHYEAKVGVPFVPTLKISDEHGNIVLEDFGKGSKFLLAKSRE